MGQHSLASLTAATMFVHQIAKSIVVVPARASSSPRALLRPCRAPAKVVEIRFSGKEWQASTGAAVPRQPDSAATARTWRSESPNWPGASEELGSVRRGGDWVRLTARLIASNTGNFASTLPSSAAREVCPSELHPCARRAAHNQYCACVRRCPGTRTHVTPWIGSRPRSSRLRRRRLRTDARLQHGQARPAGRDRIVIIVEPPVVRVAPAVGHEGRLCALCGPATLRDHRLRGWRPGMASPSLAVTPAPQSSSRAPL